MNKPQRIQLRRTAGFRLQEFSRTINGLAAVKVDRSTKWGNPWPVDAWGPLDRMAPDPEGAVGLFRAMLTDPGMRGDVGYPADLSELKGKNLACWCGGPFCHADVLLELANPSPPSHAAQARITEGD